MGCWGGPVSYGCYCYGCYGSYGCCGGCCGGGVVVYSGCCGGYYGGCCGGGMIYSAPVTSPPPVKMATPTTTKAAPPKQDSTQVARITVKVPEAAKLWVDNVYCPLTSTERSFRTPVLQPGQQYFYTLRVEVEKDGKVETVNRRVDIAAGQQVNVDFNAPAATTFTAQR